VSYVNLLTLEGLETVKALPVSDTIGLGDLVVLFHGGSLVLSRVQSMIAHSFGYAGPIVQEASVCFAECEPLTDYRYDDATGQWRLTQAGYRLDGDDPSTFRMEPLTLALKSDILAQQTLPQLWQRAASAGLAAQLAQIPTFSTEYRYAAMNKKDLVAQLDKLSPADIKVSFDGVSLAFARVLSLHFVVTQGVTGSFELHRFKKLPAWDQATASQHRSIVVNRGTVFDQYCVWANEWLAIRYPERLVVEDDTPAHPCYACLGNAAYACSSARLCQDCCYGTHNGKDPVPMKFKPVARLYFARTGSRHLALANTISALTTASASPENAELAQFDASESAALQEHSGEFKATHDVLAEFIYDLLRDFMPAGAVFRAVVDALRNASGSASGGCAVSAFLEIIKTTVSHDTWTCLTRTLYHTPTAVVKYHNGWLGQMAVYCTRRLREKASVAMLDPTVSPWDPASPHITASTQVHESLLYDGTGAVIGMSTLMPDGSSVVEMYAKPKPAKPE
jgi:hypothetical protein